MKNFSNAWISLQENAFKMTYASLFESNFNCDYKKQILLLIEFERKTITNFKITYACLLEDTFNCYHKKQNKV